MLLKKGDNNENVKLMQEKLGISPAVTNFGPKTEQAVKEFQTKHGLPADGIVGPKTWEMIMGHSGIVIAPVESAPIAQVGGLKLDKLKGHIPDAVIAMIPDTADKFQINTPLRLAHFLAQCGQRQQLMLEIHKRLQTKCMQTEWKMVRKQVGMDTNLEVADIFN